MTTATLEHERHCADGPSWCNCGTREGDPPPSWLSTPVETGDRFKVPLCALARTDELIVAEEHRRSSSNQPRDLREIEFGPGGERISQHVWQVKPPGK